MTFAHGWVLLLLVIPALMAIAELGGLVGGRRVALPLDLAMKRSRPALGALLRGAGVLPAAVLAVVLLILAGPQIVNPPKEVRSLTNIEIVLDVSGSMSARFPSGKVDATRYTAAMDAITAFAEQRSGDAAGLTIFGNEVLRWLPLTKDLRAIKNAAPFVDPSKVPPELGGTRVAHAVKYAHQVLVNQPAGDRLIVLLTDGESPDLSGGAGIELANQLKADGVVVYAINVGGGQAPQGLADVAIPTGGGVFNATDANSLSGVFSHINAMQPARVTQGASEVVTNATPFVIAAMLLLGLHQACLFGLRFTPW
jgi:Ca-activated chloride channel family protein